MNSIQRKTVAFVIAAITVILAYDVWAAVEGGETATISWIMMNAAYHYPLVPFAGGLVCGHFFWGLKNGPKI